jgi:hypothetical protein
MLFAAADKYALDGRAPQLLFRPPGWRRIRGHARCYKNIRKVTSFFFGKMTEWLILLTSSPQLPISEHESNVAKT